MSSPRIRVLAVDDHPLVRDGVQGIVLAEPGMAWLGGAATGAEGIERCLSFSPDVVLIDLQLPDMTGLNVVERVLQQRPATAFCALTTYAGDIRVKRALAAGARGYLLKSMPNAAIAEAIVSVAAGRPAIPPEIAADLAEHAHSETLSDRELEVLKILADGLSNKSIARRLGLSDGTVRTHVENILAKLQCSHRTEAASVAFRRGYIDIGTPVT